MPSVAALPLYTPFSSMLCRQKNLKINFPPRVKHFFSKTGSRTTVPACNASGSSLTEFNLYELLGVDNFSNRSQIKEAYRALQKRCHPDVAGPAGHDMAIVLNEAYALLSDPISRMAYDRELSKVSDFQGYTGKPMYSVWLGSDDERRAVFVDEVRCVGCLKCALFAEKTFAVESVYGRARAVAQWADSEERIQQAINTCPVDCISFVARSDLPAFEYIMSKQPRGRVRIGLGNTAGTRASDIFNEVEKFQSKFAKHNASSYKESESHRASMASAIHAIQMMSNWVYWQPRSAEATPPATMIEVIQLTSNLHVQSSIKKLKAAAEARKNTSSASTRVEGSSDYWVPSAHVLPEATNIDRGMKPTFSFNSDHDKNKPRNAPYPIENSSSHLRWGVPIAAATVAAVISHLQIGEHTGGGLKDHVGGSIALAVVNSPWCRVFLAGVTWYLIIVYIMEVVYALKRK